MAKGIQQSLREIDIKTKSRWGTKRSLYGWRDQRLGQHHMVLMEGALGFHLRFK